MKSVLDHKRTKFKALVMVPPGTKTKGVVPTALHQYQGLNQFSILTKISCLFFSTPYPTDEGICFDHQQGRCMRSVALLNMLISLLERGERCKYRHREKGGGQGRGSNNANGNNGGGWSSSDNPAHLLEQMKSMMDQVQSSPKRALSPISDLKPGR